MKKDDNQSDTDELLKNEELEPTIQQPNKRKKKYLGRINYKVSIYRSIHEINKIFIQDYYLEKNKKSLSLFVLLSSSIT